MHSMREEGRERHRKKERQKGREEGMKEAGKKKVALKGNPRGIGGGSTLKFLCLLMPLVLVSKIPANTAGVATEVNNMLYESQYEQ